MDVLKTGIQAFDELTGGFHPGELILFAGRVMVGKTDFALRTALHIAQSKSVGYFSIEMSKEHLAQSRIYVDDSGTLTVEDILERSQRLPQPLGLIVVDYIQLLTNPSTRTSVQNMDALFESWFRLKEIAVKLQVPVLALSQLHRRFEKEEPRLANYFFPTPDHRFESVADKVIFLWKSPETGIRELIVEKNRRGSFGRCAFERI